MFVRPVLLTLAIGGVAAACLGEERPEVRRITIAEISGVPGVAEQPATSFSRGPRFERARRLLPRPLPAPLPLVPDVTGSGTGQRCVPLRIEIELTNGKEVAYGECALPRSLLPACAELSHRSYGGSTPPAVVVHPGIEPKLRPGEVVRVVEDHLGGRSVVERLEAVPNDALACRFVRGCRPPRRGPVPRWAWFVLAYRGDGGDTVVPPTYLVVEDGSGAILATRDAD